MNLSLLTVLLAFVAYGCGKEPPPAASSDALIRGEMDTGASSDAEVRVYAFSADGQRQRVDLVSTISMVAADGSYGVRVDGEAIVEGEYLLIQATSSGQIVGSVLAAANFNAQSEMAAPRADTRTTGLAEVYVGALTNPDFRMGEEPAMLSVFLSEESLRELGTRASEEATLSAAVRVVLSADAAFTATLRGESMGVTETQIDRAMAASAIAAANLEATLRGGGSVDQAAFIEAFVQAHQSAGIDGEAIAAATWASAESMQSASATFNADLRGAISLHADRLRGEALARSAIEGMGSVSVEAGLAAEAAATTLRASLDAATTSAASAAAMAAFEANLRASMGTSLDVSATLLGEVMGSLDAAAREANATIAEIDAEATAAAIATTTSSAYLRMSVSATTAVESPLLEAGGVARADIDTMARLVTTAMASTGG